jgi:hypothetical protein
MATSTAIGREGRGEGDPGGGLHATELVGGGGHPTGHRVE